MEALVPCLETKTKNCSCFSHIRNSDDSNSSVLYSNNVRLNFREFFLPERSAGGFWRECEQNIGGFGVLSIFPHELPLFLFKIGDIGYKSPQD